MESSSSPEPEISMPIAASYMGSIHESYKLRTVTATKDGGGNHAVLRQEAGITPTPDPTASKKVVRYRECLKNHAASMGGHAVDGCGEFFPRGEEGTLEALKCAACGCHRNFHRREVNGESSCYYFGSPLPSNTMMVRPSAQMIMSQPSRQPNDSENYDMQGMPQQHPPFPAHSSMVVIPKMAKRVRTKFTAEQKDKMYEFAEKLGWRIQKHDEEAVQQFCMQARVKRHVLKVWMHNNKQTFAKKSQPFPETFNPVPEPA